MKKQKIFLCPFCGQPPEYAYVFVRCINPKCRLSYGAGYGNKKDGNRQPVLFTIKEWTKRAAV